MVVGLVSYNSPWVLGFNFKNMLVSGYKDVSWVMDLANFCACLGFHFI